MHAAVWRLVSGLLTDPRRLREGLDAMIEGECYAGVVPESLDALTTEERHRLYKMFRLEVVAHPDETLEVSGAILAGGEGGGRSGGEAQTGVSRAAGWVP